MPRFTDTITDDHALDALTVKEHAPDYVEVFYTLQAESIQQSNTTTNGATDYRVKLAEINRQEERLSFFPTVTKPWHRDFLKPKYTKIEHITLDGYVSFNRYIDPAEPLTSENIMMILEDLPSCFIKDYDYGLGFTQKYRFIVNAVEALSNSTGIKISDRVETGPIDSGRTFCISKGDFEEMRKAIQRTTSTGQTAANSVNAAITHNLLAQRVGACEVAVRFGRSPLRRRITQVALTGESELSDQEQEDIVHLLTENARDMAKSHPRRIADLQNDIEIVSLTELIVRYEQMLRRKLSEHKWQRFFNDNPFILTLALGYPVVKVRDQASVGGHRLSGRGGKIADFILRHSMSDNAAIVEIKTPHTKLLNARPLRSGVYTPSAQLVGAINQSLDQKYHFDREIMRIRDDREDGELQSYAVQCCLIAGIMPGDDDRMKSFEIFRHNSKHVKIVTFDELLAKLRHLVEILTSGEEEQAEPMDVNELPF